MARLKFDKEKIELKANDPQAETPEKKRERPKDPRVFQWRMMELCLVFEGSMAEKESSDPMEDGKESDDSDEDIWNAPEEWE